MTPGRIVLLGATGYTGRLTAEALIAHGERPVLAGRDPERLAPLAEELGDVETAVADVEQTRSLRALVERGDVIVTTVGPFARVGSTVLAAAIDAGATYIDCAAEPAFVRGVFEQHARASVPVLTAFGWESVPGNLAAELVLREAPDAVRVDVGYLPGR